VGLVRHSDSMNRSLSGLQPWIGRGSIRI